MRFWRIFNLFFVLVFFAQLGNAFASDDYLWLELGQSTTQEDGRIVQPVYIFWGQYPNNKKELPFNDFKIFCSLGESDELGQMLYYKIDPSKEDGKNFINLTSSDSDWYKIIVEANNIGNSENYRYCATLSFSLFDNRGVINKDIDRFFDLQKINSTFDPIIYYKRVREEFPVNKIRNSAIMVDGTFQGKRLRNKQAIFIDQLGESSQIVSSSGFFNYKPTGKYNLLLKENNFIGQGILVIEHSLGKDNYMLVSTILGGDVDLPLGGSISHNLRLGLIIFFISFLATLTTTIVLRRRFMR